MEANQYALQTTPHSCNAPSSKGSYDWCDKGGQCANNVKNMDWNTFGPGDQYKINTNNWFHLKINFVEENGQF